MATPEYFYDAPIIGPDRSTRWFSHLVHGVAFVVFKVCFRYRIIGREHLVEVPQGKGAILAGNHASMADPLFGLLANHMNVRYIGKEELFEGNAILRGGLARIGSFPIRRDSADRTAIKRAVACLKRGEYVGIFPEGTRVRPERHQEVKFHAGAVLIANMAKTCIIPIALAGTDRIKPAGSHFMHFPRVTVYIDRPIYPSEFDDLPKKERADACINEVMRRVYAMRDGQYPPPPAPDHPEIAEEEVTPS